MTPSASWPLRLALAGLVLTTTALAQEPPVKPAQPGRIAGTVVTDAGLPVVGATVTITSGVSGTTTSRRSAASDASGAFDFRDVTPGAHRLAVSKPGFYQAGRGAAGDGRAVTVRAGENVRGVTVTLAGAGAVTGRIVDDLGEPVDQLQVFALRWGRSVDGRRALIPTGDADATDDRGQFRVFNLPPGDYVVMATKVATRPSLPGALMVAASGASGPFDMQPMYFPGTRYATEAQVLTLGAGQEASASFVWEAARALRISGTVVGGVPQTLFSQISLSTASTSGSLGSLGPGGTFLFEGLAPGDYVLTVRAGSGAFASVPLVVRDSDLTGLVVTPRPPARITGSLTFDGGAPPPKLFPLQLLSGDGGDVMSVISGDYVGLQEDGRFEAQSGRSRVFFNALNPEWTVTGVTVGGEDAYFTGIDLADRSTIENVRVTVTNRLTRVSGRVMSDRGEPLDGATVTLFHVDSPQAPIRMVLHTLRTDAEGRFETKGLRRGSYVAVASEIADTLPGDPEFLDQLREVGRRFSLDDGQSVTLDLKLSEGLR